MAKLTMTEFLRDQYKTLPPPLQADLTNKTVMVTGANVGIGFEAAKIFAKMHPKKLLLGCRNEEKGKIALALMEKETNYHGIELAVFDYGNFDSVIKYAEGFKNEPLDILVANAGIGVGEYEETKDGWESSLQVNHLSTALLSILLLPNLVRTAQANGTISRLVIVASEMHFWAKFDEKLRDVPNFIRRLSDKEYCTPQVMMERYQITKLMNILFMRALSERLSPSVPLIPTSVNPGFCHSELQRHVRDMGIATRLRFGLMNRLLARTGEQGARQLIWAALGPDGKEGKHVSWLRGAYVSTQSIREPSDFVISLEGAKAQDRIWEETIQILSKVCPDIHTCVDEYLTS